MRKHAHTLLATSLIALGGVLAPMAATFVPLKEAMALGRKVG